MSDFVVQLDPIEFPTGQAVARVRVAEGKYATFTIKNGDTLKTLDAATAYAISSLGPKVVAPTTAVAKPTHDVDAKPKEDLPQDPKLAVQDGAIK